MFNYTADEVIANLEKQNYFANKQIAYSLMGAIRDGGSPLLIEGDPGVGKTSLAEATAKMLNIPLIRVQCYEGISPESILYDYDYQRQLLVVSAIREKLNEHIKDMDVNESIHEVAENVEFFGKDFLLKRPILRALMEKGRKVLLIDEIDKANEEIEHALLEVLSDFALTIPEYGTVTCNNEDRPIVFLTSNNYRELSDAMRRRCGYLYIYHKPVEEIRRIIAAKVDNSPEFIDTVSKCLFKMQKFSLKHSVSISEGIEWAKFLTEVLHCTTADDIEASIEPSIGYLAKSRADIQTISTSLTIEKPTKSKDMEKAEPAEVVFKEKDLPPKVKIEDVADISKFVH